MDFSKLEKQIGLVFKNQALLREAMTHRSYLNEHTSPELAHNERLEYLGDAVLELAVTLRLFQTFPSYTEGKLTSLRAALVNYRLLSRVAQKLKLEECLLMSKGEKRDQSGRAREVILANAIEALIGAIYLDLGFEAVNRFVEKNVMAHLSEVLKKELYRDPKSVLQEITQEKLKITPHYKVMSEKGPAHEREFEVGVYFGEELVAKGKGFSKQDAETAAAERALEKVTSRNRPYAR